MDPGVTGALALHVNGSLEDIQDMPVHDTRVDGAAISVLLTRWAPDFVFIENTQPMPRNGVVPSFKLGLNTGIVIGVVQALQHPLIRVRPQTWKGKMGVSRMDKNGIRGVVREIYPSWASCFARVKDHDRAEAVLISRYGVTVNLQEANAS